MAAIGLVSSFLSIFFTMMLAFVAARRGKLKYLLLPYMLKNICVVVGECLMFYYNWYEPYNESKVKYTRYVWAFCWTFAFGLLFPLYATFICFMYLRDLRQRELVARKLYVAWRQRKEVAEKVKETMEKREKIIQKNKDVRKILEQ